MTVIAKVYDTHLKAAQAMQKLCEFNQPHKVLTKDMTVELLTGDRIIFRCVSDMQDVQQYFCGREIQWVDLDSGSDFEPEILQWLQSRIRTPSSMIKES